MVTDVGDLKSVIGNPSLPLVAFFPDNLRMVKVVRLQVRVSYSLAAGNRLPIIDPQCVDGRPHLPPKSHGP